MFSFAVLTRSLSFENGFAEAEPTGIGTGTGMVSIGSGLPAELLLATAGAAAVSKSLLSFETGTVDFGRGATWLTKLDTREGVRGLNFTASCAGLGSESPLELAGNQVGTPGKLKLWK